MDGPNQAKATDEGDPMANKGNDNKKREAQTNKPKLSVKEKKEKKDKKRAAKKDK